MSKERIEKIEQALLDLAESVESGEWNGVYQRTAMTLLPDSKHPSKTHYKPRGEE